VEETKMNRLSTLIVLCSVFLIGCQSVTAAAPDHKKFTESDPKAKIWRVNLVKKDHEDDPDLFEVNDLFVLQEISSTEISIKPGKRMKKRGWKEQGYKLNALRKQGTPYVCGLVDLSHPVASLESHMILITLLDNAGNEIQLKYGPSDSTEDCEQALIHGGLVHADR
jgi:hypothetical protein